MFCGRRAVRDEWLLLNRLFYSEKRVLKRFYFKQIFFKRIKKRAGLRRERRESEKTPALL
jgi:hypothetical protein